MIMKTIIIPVDFSDVSINAAKYATALSTEYEQPRLVLFHSTVATIREQGQTIEDVVALSTIDMDNLIVDLKNINPNATFIIEVSEHYVFECIETLYNQYEASLIVMGITGKNKLEQKLIGSNTLKVAQNSRKPVLIIPGDIAYKPVEKVAVAIQFKEDLLKKIPANTIINFTNELDAELLVLNVALEGDDTPNSYVFAGQQAAHLMFDKAKSSFHLMEDKDVVNAITTFVADNNVQVVVSIAEEHGFFESLFKGSITQKLAFYTHVPLLVVQAMK